MTVDDRRLRPTENNLTLVRLVLASAVIWTHSIWRVTGVEGRDEFFPLIGAPISSLAVDGFFFLSGFLVYSSLLRRGTVGDFVLARLARLWPALAVSVLATVAVGFAITRADAASYFGGETARFVAGNLSMVAGQYNLTGVECGQQLCNVNGSLWTITWEVRCYILLALAALVGLARPAMMKMIILPATLIFAVAVHLPGVAAAIRTHAGEGLLYNVVMVDRLWTMFALGIAAYLWRDRIPLSWSICLSLLGLLVLSQATMPVPHLSGVFTAYAVLCTGFLSARRRAVSGTWPDYSYGMYIYAFPVMMAVSALVPFTSHVWLAAACC